MQWWGEDLIQELGHLLGHGHSDDPRDLMESLLRSHTSETGSYSIRCCRNKPIFSTPVEFRPDFPMENLRDLGIWQLTRIQRFSNPD